MPTMILEVWKLYEDRVKEKGIAPQHIETMKMIFYAGAAGVLSIEGLDDPCQREALQIETTKFANSELMKKNSPFN